VHDLAGEADPPGGPVQLDATDLLGGRPVGRRLGRPGRPAQQRPHTGHQLARAERLGQVVVGAHLKPHHQVQLGVSGGEHEDGDGAVPLDAPAHLEAVEAGEHDVEDHQVGTDPLHQRHRRGPVDGHLDLQALAAEAGGHGVGDRRLVLDHHHGCHPCRVPGAACSGPARDVEMWCRP